MTTSENEQDLPASVERWRGEFMEAATRHASQRASWRRRVMAPLAAIVLAGSAGVAIAEVASPTPPPFTGETHAYLNLETGEPIRCPDGSLLTYTPPPGTSEYTDPKCADGSIPSVYQKQLEALIQNAENQEFGSLAIGVPTFAYALDRDE